MAEGGIPQSSFVHLAQNLTHLLIIYQITDCVDCIGHHCMVGTVLGTPSHGSHLILIIVGGQD